MAGCQMCSGENSVPTWLFHCFDRSILTIDRSPELTAVTPRPSVKNTPDGSTLESRAPTTPVALRPVSARHAPAVVPTPCAQFRKDCWHLQKSSSGRWLRRSQRFFRNWAPEGDNEAGQFNTAGLPNIMGDVYANSGSWTFSGAFFTTSGTGKAVGVSSSDISVKNRFSIDASKSNPIYGGSHTVMPPSINQPVILYLGRSS